MREEEESNWLKSKIDKFWDEYGKGLTAIFIAFIMSAMILWKIFETLHAIR